MDRNLRKTRVGIVTSDKMEKTIVVSIIITIFTAECGYGCKYKYRYTNIYQ